MLFDELKSYVSESLITVVFISYTSSVFTINSFSYAQIINLRIKAQGHLVRR